MKTTQKSNWNVLADVVIDATDLGDGLALAGAAYDLGMEARSATGESNEPRGRYTQRLRLPVLIKQLKNPKDIIPRCSPDHAL